MFLLKSRFQFQDSDFRVLTDDQASPSQWPTRSNMFEGFRWLAADARPGDSLVFHYSGMALRCEIFWSNLIMFCLASHCLSCAGAVYATCSCSATLCVRLHTKYCSAITSTVRPACAASVPLVACETKQSCLPNRLLCDICRYRYNCAVPVHAKPLCVMTACLSLLWQT